MGDDTISLKEYFFKQMEDIKAYIDMKFTGVDKANVIALENLNKRLESMNEFRDTLKDQAAHFITRAEYDSMCERCSKLEITQATIAGKASQQSVTIAYIMSIISLIVGALGALKGGVI